MILVIKKREGMVYVPGMYVKVAKLDDNQVRLKVYQAPGKEPILTDISKQAGDTATVTCGDNVEV